MLGNQLTAAGCKSRRQRLLDALKPTSPMVFGDPLNLRWLAGCYVDPFSLGADFGALLQVTPDNRATLHYAKRTPPSVKDALVDELVPVVWYDGKHAANGDGGHRWSLHDSLEKLGGRMHDSFMDPDSRPVWEALTALRRAKDPDEVDQLKQCMRAGEAGHAWARAHAKAGMTELDVYNGVFTTVSTAVGHPAIVYGDFRVSPGSECHGGPPTGQVLKDGDTLILDFSVILGGYRSDFTNTLVIGGKPTADQKRIFELTVQAMKAGEKLLKAGTPCQAVYDAVNGVFQAADVADKFTHHAGHGLGISHPEAPFFVKHSSETLIAGDVVTLEPGLYIDGIGGVRIENNYAISATGYEQLSHHAISLT
jgi:Xaa-Pro dipeptidase